MINRQQANTEPLDYLLDLIEKRFDLRLHFNSPKHLKSVCEHYRAKRQMLLWEHGEAKALKRQDYIKAVLISETIRLMLLREIDPYPRRKKRKFK